MEYDDRVMCPLIDEKIDPMECVDVVDCVLNPLFLNSLPEKYKAKENFKDICKQCKWHCYWGEYNSRNAIWFYIFSCNNKVYVIQ